MNPISPRAWTVGGRDAVSLSGRIFLSGHAPRPFPTESGKPFLGESNADKAHKYRQVPAVALIVSDETHDGTISQGHTTYQPDKFRPLQVCEKEYRAQAWTHVPRTFGVRPVSLVNGRREHGGRHRVG
ncbi:hypothetical protein ACU635_06690 [[Actinomadura] parvosata]|uniref:hypothetical protein n=1 Tax=[Actinomadura] parvosata TaxID=1955412 RepID=UPI00406C61FA